MKKYTTRRSGGTLTLSKMEKLYKKAKKYESNPIAIDPYGNIYFDDGEISSPSSRKSMLKNIY